MKKTAALLALGLFAGLAPAQDANTLSGQLLKHWETSKAFTLAVVDKMPDADFSFKATPAEMSFGEMASHIADANVNYCSAAEGVKPGPKGTDFSKQAAIKHITDSFDFCIAGIQKSSDTSLTKLAGEGARKASPFERYWGAFTHTAHHRAQLEVYLRLKGITPPDYKF